MSHSYHLAQTYAPTPVFDEYLANLPVDPEHFCQIAGIHPSTLERLQELRSTSNRTAQRICIGFTLVYRNLSPWQAFDMMFTRRPPVYMDRTEDGTRYRRRPDSA